MEASPLELLVFSGAYDEALARVAGGYSAEDAPWVVGALALSGRLEEAESAFAALSTGASSEGQLAQGRFFLVAGLCHAGQVARALRQALPLVVHTRAPDARRRFWAYQALALVRCFEGRFRLSRRLGRRALKSAVEAAFPYARFLALDLLAHVTIHTGQVFAGLRLLSQAEALATALGYADNAQTQRTARTVFRLRMLLDDVDVATREVENVVHAAEVSYFTRRNGLIELAFMAALRGDAARSRAALDEARHIALPGTDRRGKTRFLLCNAACTALADGPERAHDVLEEARAEAQDQPTLLAEVGFVELVLFGERDPARVEAFERVARLTGSRRAQIALDVARGRTLVHPVRVEDGLGRLFLSCIGRSPEERLELVREARLFGLVPWALGVNPGRRILLTRDRLFTENHGKVVEAELPSRPSVKVLLALRRGYRGRAELLNDVWGISRFVPMRHTAVLHTAISRLRVGLAEPDWIVTHEDGYSLAQGVEVLVFGEHADTASTLPEPSPSVAPQAESDDDRVLRFIEKEGPVSSARVAESLRISASSALRLLRSLAEAGKLVRDGRGKSTRYDVTGRK